MHYRIIHRDDTSLAAIGKHVPAVCTFHAPDTLTQSDAEAVMLEFASEYDCTFPMAVIDSIGRTVATDTRRF
jgi:hypothetical protein